MKSFDPERLVLALMLCGIVGAGMPRPTFGHADIKVRIADVTEMIEADPANAELYLKRGELHRLHRDWESAQADYLRAAAIDPHLSKLDFLRGRMLYEAERPREALVELDRFLADAHDADEGSRRESLITRARVRVVLGRYEEAAEDYTRAIATLHRHTPEYYLERSQALARAGLHERALRGVDEAIERAGPLVTLQFSAIELALELERFEGALARLETISRWMPAEMLWFRRGEILRRAGRVAEARHAYRQALELIETSASRRRSTRALQDLERQLRAVLDDERQ